ncbi:MAG: SDR family NAD(P)-dependent oxidoreductase [Saprospiraceae bacterium]|nr:SDR family NAD(P)-dependent oxidoreductase [Saprospiraceae bacterium]MCB0542607.1 SDR family NAD(P)-dependent oxidoreductase [Saprospiraceae bacterium]MCB0574347.1 SDR family NAD(P)-dependent oxidoreductase [Saprospiraceae bacterium]MCB9305584.1 SDR family NAD(P)-dependent oxidoreductase [Lewinellaceae bacterium]MCB9355020.1 SDR family NAD(P)-dependent oxidoreductase [Lewinellaceae bacterium]
MKLLLIGMGPGNGLSIARRFGREGFHILMVARNKAKLEQYVSDLAAEGILATGIPADIADEKAFKEAMQQVAAEHQDITILHYNASAYNPATPSGISLEVLHSDLSINLIGAIIAVQAVFPLMKSRKRGTIFLTGGGTALQAPAMLASLGMGKAGLRNLAFSLAQECKPLGIHVATLTISGMVQPGTKFDPDLIAEKFWTLYEQARDNWETEVIWQ